MLDDFYRNDPSDLESSVNDYIAAIRADDEADHSAEKCICCVIL